MTLLNPSFRFLCQLKHWVFDTKEILESLWKWAKLAVNFREPIKLIYIELSGPRYKRFFYSLDHAALILPFYLIHNFKVIIILSFNYRTIRWERNFCCQHELLFKCLRAFNWFLVLLIKKIFASYLIKWWWDCLCWRFVGAAALVGYLEYFIICSCHNW